MREEQVVHILQSFNDKVHNKMSNWAAIKQEIHLLHSRNKSEITLI